MATTETEEITTAATFSVLEKLLADGVRRVRVGWAIKGKELRALAYTLDCHTTLESLSFSSILPDDCADALLIALIKNIALASVTVAGGDPLQQRILSITDPGADEVAALCPLVRGLRLVVRTLAYYKFNRRTLFRALSQTLRDDPEAYPDVVLTALMFLFNEKEYVQRNRLYSAFLFESPHVPEHVKAALVSYLEDFSAAPVLEDLLRAVMAAGGDAQGVRVAACQIGAAGVVQEMMKDPSWDLNESIGDSGRTPIYIASQNGHAVIVDLLLRAGADKDSADEDDTTPITIASFNGHAAVVELLLRAGADMDKSDEDGAGPLHVACQADHKVVVEMLLRAGADKEKAKKDGATPLYIAAQSCNVGLVELLLEHGASVFTARANGWMPISAAADRGHIELCELLCAAAIASTHPDDGKKTIHLQGCHIRDASAQALSKALKADWSVSALDLSGNEIQDAGAVALAEALAVNPNLTTLDLSDNLIGDTGAQALADALAASGHIHRSIHLGSNRLRKEGKQSLSRALESTVCVIVGVTGLNEEALAINISLDSLRKTVVKPRIRSLSALLVDPKDFDLADVVKDLLKMTTRALTAVL